MTRAGSGDGAEHGHVDKQMMHLRGLLTDNDLFSDDETNPDPLGGTPLVTARGRFVQGTVGDRWYTVAVLWGGEVAAAGCGVELRGWDAAWVRELLDSHHGEAFRVTATGPSVRLGDDPRSVLAALGELTRIESTRGDDPPGWPRPDPDVDH